MSGAAEINTAEYWDERFRGSWQEAHGAEQTAFFAEMIVEYLPQWFKSDIARHRLSICDWGCAEGDAVAYLAQIFPQNSFAGVDFAQAAIESAQKKYPHLKFAAEDWLTAEKPLSKYDMILCSNVLEHFREPLTVMRETLGKAARKYIVVLVPYNEDPEKMEKEHFFRFIKQTIPFAWGEWVCLHFEVIDTSVRKASRWHGLQALSIYAHRAWIKKSGLEFSLASYPSDSRVFEAQMQRARSAVTEQAHARELAEKKLETQMAHDKIIMTSNTNLVQQNDKLRDEHLKGLNRIKDLEVAAAQSALTAKELAAAKQEAERLARELEESRKYASNDDARHRIEQLTAEIAGLRTAAEQAEAWKQTAERWERRTDELKRDHELLFQTIERMEPVNRDLLKELESRKSILLSLQDHFETMWKVDDLAASEHSALVQGSNGERLRQAHIEIQRIAAENKMLQARLDAASNERTLMDARIRELDQRREVAEAMASWSRAAKARALQESAKDLERYESERKQFPKLLEIVRSELEASRAELRQLEAQIAGLDKSRSDLISQIAGLDQVRVAQLARISALEQESAALNTQFAELDRQAAALKSLIASDASERSKLLEQIASLEKDRAALYRIRSMALYPWAVRVYGVGASMRSLFRPRRTGEIVSPSPEDAVVPLEAQETPGRAAMPTPSASPETPTALGIEIQPAAEPAIAPPEIAVAEPAVIAEAPAPFFEAASAAIEPAAESAAGAETIASIAEPLPVAPRQLRTLSQLRLGVILDKFTHACLKPICTLIPFRPDDWRKVLSDGMIDMLFVESAWHGNDNAWEYRVGDYPAMPNPEFDELLDWCKEQGIPRVFWNKEDPPHFDRFIKNASKFDYIFTTGALCIPKYQERCGHDRVAALQFAAQRNIHNPVLQRPRLDRVCFAGTYYANDFEERRKDMDVLLAGGAARHLDIFDRMHGYQGFDKDAYQFPPEFRKFVRGGLDYDEMLQAYRSYRAFLNVNSVYESPTMFSRRVFELMACGTPVVTTRSLGIEKTFGDLVAQVKTPEDVTTALDRLFDSPAEWHRTSALGIRTVLTKHTYRQRMADICSFIGLAIQAEAADHLAVVVHPAGDPGALAETLANQTEAPARIFVLEADGGPAHVEALAQKGFAAELLSAESVIEILRGNLSANPVAFLDSRHAYGPNYLLDARLALAYSGVSTTGLSTYFESAGADEARLVDGAGEECMMREEIFGPTLAALGGRFTAELLQAACAGGLIKVGRDCYARGRFEFLAGAASGVSGAVARQVCL